MWDSNPSTSSQNSCASHYTTSSIWQPGVDSNRWMQESKSCALPLGYRAILLIMCEDIFFKTLHLHSRFSKQDNPTLLPIILEPFRCNKRVIAILMDRTFTTIQCFIAPNSYCLAFSMREIHCLFAGRVWAISQSAMQFFVNSRLSYGMWLTPLYSYTANHREVAPQAVP